MCLKCDVSVYKCHTCYSSFSVTVKRLLFPKIYHNFKCTLSFSLSSNVHVQNNGVQNNIAKNVLSWF